jgi:DNA polymerase-3 subunit beta
MKLVIERAALLKALGHVQSVVERRNTIPILSNIKLDAKGDDLQLRATDMDLEVAETVAARVEGEGAITVPAHTLYDIVRKLPEGADVKLDGSGGGDTLRLTCGRSRFALSCLPVEDFPLMAGGDMSHGFRLSAGELRSLIDRTRFAISTEETRYYLNGIFLHSVMNGATSVLRAVATDGHRLASVEVALPAGAAGMPGVIIPRKTVSEVRKLVEEENLDVDVALSDTKVRFAVGNAVLTSKLIDGTFPDYQRVIPTHNDKQLDVPCRDFAAAVDRVSAISTERSRAVKMRLRDGTLELIASSPEHGTASEELEVEYQGEAMEIGFNSRYLLDITQHIEGEHVRFVMADGASPTIMQQVGDSSALYVLMPMRV